MALIDNLIETVVSNIAGDKAPALTDFLKNNGGLGGLADKFRNGGASDLFASWVGTGENKGISAEKINAVLGNPQVQAFATKLGIDTSQASDFIAKTLPQVIDKLSPDGKLPSEGGPSA